MKGLLVLIFIFCAALSNAQTPSDSAIFKPIERMDTTHIVEIIKLKVRYKINELGNVTSAHVVSGKGDYKGMVESAKKNVMAMHFTPCVPPAKCKKRRYIKFEYKLKSRAI